MGLRQFSSFHPDCTLDMKECPQHSRMARQDSQSSGAQYVNMGPYDFIMFKILNTALSLSF